MPNILVTGFEPFEAARVNPSWEAARALDGREISGARIHARQLPCVLATANAALLDAMAQVEPELVLCLGLAAGRADVSVERVAINIVDARIPDNAGSQPIDEPIVPGGPAAYFSTLPIKAMVAALRAKGVPASVSQTAGTYVCNAVFYGLAHHIATQRPTVRGGFVHVPCLPEMAALLPGAPSMSLETLIYAVATMVETAMATEHDIKVEAGALH
ncbi:pyroglutamyl-peptidase I [Allopusillimonas soli]|uniref:Pyrrolidone-carboxylate peptidase n=1 Tax=Allopusillimonas soli TaxID=659016 RepID=A0A853F921_9BURK|nr:pyroglutamyl-peptidase I [Allopusillimonas soli]NYT36583.1 pyroglutamyl-peptidase I [Allopusillimonas soli]TEA75075.1 pyroglutamyl-peptidase I [Allopusillimonas soli]